MLPVWQYLNAVLGREEASEVDRPVVEQAFARIAEMEARLTDRVHEFLASQPGGMAMRA